MEILKSHLDTLKMQLNQQKYIYNLYNYDIKFILGFCYLCNEQVVQTTF